MLHQHSCLEVIQVQIEQASCPSNLLHFCAAHAPGQFLSPRCTRKYLIGLARETCQTITDLIYGEVFFVHTDRNARDALVCTCTTMLLRAVCTMLLRAVALQLHFGVTPGLDDFDLRKSQFPFSLQKKEEKIDEQRRQRWKDRENTMKRRHRGDGP